MQPHLHAAAHLPSHGSVTISPSWSAFEAVPLSSPGSFKCRAYADRSTSEHYSCLPFSSLTMQNDSPFCHPYHQKSTGFCHSASASDDAVALADVAPVPTNTRVPIYPHEWSSPDMPVIGNSRNSLTVFSGTAERFPRVARPRAAWEFTPPGPFMSFDYSFDAHQRPWISAAETERTNPRTPQREWGQSHLTGMQSNRSQVPSDPNVSEGAWSHRANDHHAVAAPAQHASLHETNYLSCDIPAPPYTPTSSHSSTGQVHTSFDGVRCWMATSLLGRVPSPSHHRRRFRRSYPHPDRVICDQCQKQMRPQSLKRHVREVHNRIKRHVKSGFRAGS